MNNDYLTNRNTLHTSTFPINISKCFTNILGYQKTTQNSLMTIIFSIRNIRSFSLSNISTDREEYLRKASFSVHTHTQKKKENDACLMLETDAVTMTERKSKTPYH